MENPSDKNNNITINLGIFKKLLLPFKWFFKIFKKLGSYTNEVFLLFFFIGLLFSINMGIHFYNSAFNGEKIGTYSLSYLFIEFYGSIKLVIHMTFIKFIMWIGFPALDRELESFTDNFSKEVLLPTQWRKILLAFCVYFFLLLLSVLLSGSIANGLKAVG
jgi:hypothetical protein